ncbi:metallopeptidase TldD-related protein [Candidatus Latescibacterota bacterium]
MKIHKITVILTLAALAMLFHHGVSTAQNSSTRDIILSAMRDEMARNMNLLEMENMERPFFISYNLYDVKTMEIIATHGSLVKSDESRYRNHSARVMVGDYSLNDENFQDSGYSYGSSMVYGSSRLPLEDNYDAIRRSLWIATDSIYKRAVELYEHKKAALEQQTAISEITNLDDFSKAPTVKYTGQQSTLEFNRAEWEKTACEISKVFARYSDIYSSKVRVFFYRGDLFLTNSEGTEVIQPLTLVSVQINAFSQAVDGEPLSNHISFVGSVAGDLPNLKTMKKSVEGMADDLIALRTAPAFDELYFGPVLLEDQASAEFFSQRLFGDKNGLIASRRPVVSDSRIRFSDDETLEDRIALRILAHDYSIKAVPGLSNYQGQNLIGSYEVDAEGVIPPAEITLVENGMLKTLLSNRTPTAKISESNAHQRHSIGSGYRTTSTIAPGVIHVFSSSGQTYSDLKADLMKRAETEGLDYGILIRKLKPKSSGIIYYDPMANMALSYGGGYGSSLTEPLMVYRVNVRDGSEELIRSVKIGSIGLGTLRHIAGTTGEEIVYNTLTTVSGQSGIPASFIVPRALILEELEVNNKKSGYIPKLPVVSNPLSR